MIHLVDANTFAVSGNLDFTSAEAIFQQGKKVIDDNQECTVDLSSTNVSNSAALATLIAWQNYSAKLNKTIQFINLSDQLLSIAQLCGLQDILNINKATEWIN